MSAEPELAVVGENGWRDPADYPSNDRLVQIAWEDGSYSEKTKGSFDSRQGETERIWWAWWPSVHPLPPGGVGAWREIQKPNTP